jgi:hypothetical protein
MVSHILTLAVIQCVHALIGLALGAFLILRSFHIPPGRLSRLEPGDLRAFLIAGLVCLALSLARAFQGALALRLAAASRRRGVGPGPGPGRLARRLGVLLWVTDLLDIFGFPLTTALGTYGILVYRNPEALDFFEGVFSAQEASIGLETGRS